MYRMIHSHRLVLVFFSILALTTGAWWLSQAQVDASDMAPSDASLRQAEQAGERLGELSDAFRAVARVVKPSVVFISVQAQAQQMTPRSRMAPRAWPFGPGDDSGELFRRFFDDPWGWERGWRFEPERRDDFRHEDDDRSPRYDAPRQIGAGSGWVWDVHGHIITNHHVIRQAGHIEVIFYDGSSATAEVVGSDPKTDVAVLRIDRSGLYPARRAEQLVEQGDLVFAFGSPFQYRFSMSQGVVSGTDRAVGILGPEGYENFIQTDAAINPGNSGGPLTNARGEVVGMNTAIATRTGAFSGIGFAVPIDVIEPVVQQLIDTGEVTRGYIGAWIGDDPDLVRSFGADQGVVIHDVMANSPAADAGLEPGDVVTHINDQPVDTSRKLRQIVAGIKPGQKATFRIIRDGDAFDVTVIIGHQPTEGRASLSPNGDLQETPGAGRETLRQLGIESIQTFEREHAQRQGWRHEPGVMVAQVRPGSIAQMAGLRPGMVITHVMNEPVHSAEQLVRQLVQYDATQGLRFRVRIDDQRTTFIFMRLLEP